MLKPGCSTHCCFGLFDSTTGFPVQVSTLLAMVWVQLGQQGPMVLEYIKINERFYFIFFNLIQQTTARQRGRSDEAIRRAFAGNSQQNTVPLRFGAQLRKANRHCFPEVKVLMWSCWQFIYIYIIYISDFYLHQCSNLKTKYLKLLSVCLNQSASILKVRGWHRLWQQWNVVV